ncbi:MAG: hypothetical protein ACREV6_22205 [Clostridium sp.]|uniref:hypothetical protein n=1 Tax=Clostridium sp. TaxID=1506 RepID=UPI003D6CD652
MQLIEVVPFKNVKERFRLVEKYRLIPNCIAEVFRDYLYVEVFDFDIRKKRKGRRKHAKKSIRK